VLELSGANLKQTACQSSMLATSFDHTRSTIGSQSTHANLTEHITLNNTQTHAFVHASTQCAQEVYSLCLAALKIKKMNFNCRGHILISCWHWL